MYVAVVPNRGSPPAILLRESYREGGKTKNRTLANLSRWPAARRRAAAPRTATPAGSGAGPDRRAADRAGGQAGDGADAGPRHRQPFARRDAGARQGRRQGGLWRARLAGPRAALHRIQAGPPPSEGWRAAALRRHLHLSRRALLRTGAAWLQPRPPWRPAADCHRPDVHSRRLPGSGRGVRRQYRRSADAVGADRQVEAALPPAARGDGGRPRTADQRADRADTTPGRSGLDNRATGSGDQAARRRGRAVAALAVR